MSGGSVPAWVAVVTAVFTGGLGFCGAVLSARTTARSREQELSQQRLLHGANSRLQALDEAATTAIDYRERVAATLSILADSDQPRVGVEPLWSWERTDVAVFLRHDAALMLRFGRDHQVSVAWRLYGWEVAAATETARRYRHLLDEASDGVSPDVKETANVHRDATRQRQKEFLEVASIPFEQALQADVGSAVP